MFSRFSTMFSPGNSRGANSPVNPNEPNHPRKRFSSSNSSDLDPESWNNYNSDQFRHQSCQIDNSKALIAKISALYEQRLLSDITLVINGKEFPAHRLILCASSDVFQAMLMNPNWAESKEERIVLQESFECEKVFGSFLKYLYTGHLHLELSIVLHLLVLADKYNVKDLISLCLEYMTCHIASAAINNNLVLWYQYTTNCSHDKISEECKNFIKWNFELVAKAEDFHLLDLDLMISILSDDDIVVYEEYTLFQYLECWIKAQLKSSEENDEKEDNLRNLVELTMIYIRFPMMPPQQLADLLLSPLITKFNKILDNMAIGMSYHRGADARIRDLIDSHPNRAKLFTPRIYCSDKWSVPLSIDHFTGMNHYQSKTLVFSTFLSLSDNSEKQIEWVVDFYPKGVWFSKHYLIIWQGTVEVPEYVMPTVRLSVQCKEDAGARMQIGVLIAGQRDGVEHVMKVVRKKYVFTERDKVLNFDDLIPYEELIKCAKCSTLMNDPNSMTLSPNSRCCGARKSPFFVGPNYDSIKLRIVIIPMCEFNPISRNIFY